MRSVLIWGNDRGLLHHKLSVVAFNHREQSKYSLVDLNHMHLCTKLFNYSMEVAGTKIVDNILHDI